MNLSFTIELTSTADAKRTLVSNVGRAIVKKLAVKFEGNQIMSVDDFDVFECYQDLWKTASEKKNAVRQDIISYDVCTINCIKLRINAADKSTGNARDKAIANTYGNKFVIPLDFEMGSRTKPPRTNSPGQNPLDKIPPRTKSPQTKSPWTKSPHYIPPNCSIAQCFLLYINVIFEGQFSSTFVRCEIFHGHKVEKRS